MSAASRSMLLALSVACARPPPPVSIGPIEAVQAFSAAVSRGDAPAAWELLSARTQAAADAVAADAGLGSGAGRRMLFGSAIPGGKVLAREAGHDGGVALVVVTGASGESHTFRTVREGNGYRLDLDVPASRDGG